MVSKLPFHEKLRENGYLKEELQHLEAVSRKRKYKYKVNKNVSWGMLKYRVVRLFLEKDSRDILTRLPMANSIR